MLLLLHILVALAGIVMSSVSLLFPSQVKIRLSYGLVMLTVLSGTIIVFVRHLGILSVCLSGLLYVGFTVSSLIAASGRLAKQSQRSD